MLANSSSRGEVAGGGRRRAMTAVLIGVAIAGASPAEATVAVPAAADNAAARLPADSVASPSADPAAAPFVPEAPRLAAKPAPLADGLRELAAAPAPRNWPMMWQRLTWRDLFGLAVNDRLLREIAVAGLGLVGIAMLMRRRRRQRIGWGVLPDRAARR